MNLTQFLKTDKILNEACLYEHATPVALGYSTFVSCDLGYLPLVAELVTLAEQLKAEPVLVLSEKHMSPEMVQHVFKCLSDCFPCLTIQVEENVADLLYRHSQMGRKCVGMVGERVTLREAQYHYNNLYETKAQEVVLDLSQYKSSTKKSITEGNFHNFRAASLECSPELAYKMFERLREVYNG